MSRRDHAHAAVAMSPAQPRTSLLKSVTDAIRHESLIPDDGRVCVALSGGADSVALTLLLRDAAPSVPFTLAGVVHVNHQLRPEADADEQFCRELGSRLALPVEVARVDVARVATDAGISIEEAGHRERYRVFDALADRRAIDRIATAHTRDDQAETYLMRLMRGAGPEGLAGIRPRSGRVIRPLLQIGRAELRSFLSERREPFREDETNTDLSVTRNRIRHELLPLLERRFSPSIVDVLARTAIIARGDAEWLEHHVNAVAPSIVSYREGRATVDAARLTAQPDALARRVARQALEQVAGRSVGFEAVERLLEVARGSERTLGEADFPGCRVERTAGNLVIAPPAPRRRMPSPGARSYRYELGVPGRVRIPEAGLEISAERPASVPDGPLVARSGVVAVASSELSSPLIVRNWQPGDAIRPLGLGGRKKLQDLFVDRKVARANRHAVPIVADTKRGIVWVVGHAVAEDFRVTSGTKGMLILRAERLGGAG